MGIALSLMQLLPVLTWILQCALFYDRKPHLQVPDLSRFFREFTTPPQHQSSHSPISFSSNYLRGWFPKNKKDPAPPGREGQPALHPPFPGPGSPSLTHRSVALVLNNRARECARQAPDLYSVINSRYASRMNHKDLCEPPQPTSQRLSERSHPGARINVAIVGLGYAECTDADGPQDS